MEVNACVVILQYYYEKDTEESLVVLFPESKRMRLASRTGRRLQGCIYNTMYTAGTEYGVFL